MTNVTLQTLKQIEGMGLEGQLVAKGFYQSIFDAVLKAAKQDDWRGVISVQLDPVRLGIDGDAQTIKHAIEYFVGNTVTVAKTYHADPTDTTLTIFTEGYRRGPCGP